MGEIYKMRILSEDGGEKVILKRRYVGILSGCFKMLSGCFGMLSEYHREVSECIGMSSGYYNNGNAIDCWDLIFS